MGEWGETFLIIKLWISNPICGLIFVIKKPKKSGWWREIFFLFQTSERQHRMTQAPTTAVADTKEAEMQVVHTEEVSIVSSGFYFLFR